MLRFFLVGALASAAAFVPPPSTVPRHLATVTETKRSDVNRGTVSLWSEVSIDLVGSSLSTNEAPMPTHEKSSFCPTWKEILEFPVLVPTKEDLTSLPRLKKVAIICRACVLHFSFLSTVGPLLTRGALGHGPTTPLRALAWMVNCISWHMFHSLLNDWQGADKDDSEERLRTDVGVHVLKQGFVGRRKYLAYMLGAATPGMLLSSLALTWGGFSRAIALGMSAVLSYGLLLKPLALGEILVFFAWGPLMAGYAALAAGESLPSFWSVPTLLWGSVAFGVIYGKHTDKIGISKMKTLPSMLGVSMSSFLCRLILVMQHALLGIGIATGSLPIGASLGFLTLISEFPWTMKILKYGLPVDGPTIQNKEINGTILSLSPGDRWRLWFVRFMAWHGITLGYLVAIGSGLEWLAKTAFFRAGIFMPSP